MKLELPPELLQLLLSERDISHVLSKRNETSTERVIIIVVVVLLLVFAVLAFYFLLRHYRNRGARPRYIPTRYLKSKWRDWSPGIVKHRPPSSLQEDVRRRSQYSIGRSASPANEAALQGLREGRGFDGLTSTITRTSHPPTTDAEGVDRQTSVRSIMTLPAYTASARPTEKILGREGERAGMDMVVEFPESTTEEEARREEEMESLYQIRRARREQQTARRQARDLRRATRDARNRGDRRAIAELEAQAARAEVAAMPRPDALMAEHESRDRDRSRGRRISSVAYASLGVARHDGSRVRSDSASEDGRPLLDGAAGMGSRDISRCDSPASFNSRIRADSYTLPPPRGRDRNISTSSLSRFLTPDDVTGDMDSDPDRSSGDFDAHTPFSHSRSDSPAYAEVDPNVQGRSRADSARPRASSGLRIDSTDLGTRSISQHRPSGVSVAEDAEAEAGTEEAHPPGYDNLSPIQERGHQGRTLVPLDATAGAQAQEQDREQDQIRGSLSKTLEQERGDAPPYESPVRAAQGHAQEQFTSFSRLPSIRFTPFSPFADDGE